MNKSPRVFVVAGMPRSGTTYLYHVFQKHPAIFVPVYKELDYFSVHYDAGAKYYRGFFRDMKQGQIGCDISPLYLFQEKALDGILEEPAVEWVVLAIRRPSDFALSWHAQLSAVCYGVPPLGSFVRQFTLDRHGIGFKVELTGRQSPRRRIEAFRNALGDRLLLYDFEAFGRDPLPFLQAIESFVDVRRYFRPDNVERRAINFLGRRQVRFISWLLARGLVAAWTRRLLPRRLVMALRSEADRWSSAKREPRRYEFPAEQVTFSRRAFAQDDAYVQELFRESNIVLGTGQKFEVPRVQGAGKTILGSRREADLA